MGSRPVPEEDIALPLYQGSTINQFDFFQKEYRTVSGRVRPCNDIPYERKYFCPQFLISHRTMIGREKYSDNVKIGQRNIANPMNARSLTTCVLRGSACGHSLASLSVANGSFPKTLFMSSLMNTFIDDFTTRSRVVGIHIDWHHLQPLPIPVNVLDDSASASHRTRVVLSCARLTFLHRRFAPEWLKLKRLYPELASMEWKLWWAVTEADRLRLRVEIDALCADLYGLDPDDFDWIVRDDPTDPKGFYRVDRQLPFQERLTGLAAAAFRALKEGKWSAESAASLSNDEFFDLLGIPDLTNAKAAHAKGLPGPLIEKRDGCHVWKPENFPKDDPRHGWTWNDCWKDAVALLGSEDVVRRYVEGEPKAAGASDDEKLLRLQARKPTPSQGKLF